MSKYLFGSLSIVMAMMCATARADDDVPKNIIAVGNQSVFYHVHATDISGPFTPPGTNLDVKDLDTLYLAYERRLANHVYLELAGGLPPVTKTIGKGPTSLGSVPYNGQVITTARWLAPSALIKYVFFDDKAFIRPYIGVGVNYVQFYDRDQTPAGDAGAGGPTSIELRSSFGPAGTAGVAVRATQRFGVAVSYSAARVRTHLTAITGDVIRTSDISFNPQTLVVAATFAF